MIMLALGFAAPAGAQEVNAPPGNSGVDEYLETVPGASGNQPTNRGAARSPLPAAARRALERKGQDGQAAADLAERTAPPPASQAKPPTPAAEPGSSDGGGALGALGRAASGSDEGMGPWLPVLLGLAAAAALMAAIVRRRVTRQSRT